MDKKAVSEIISYVLLISIAVSLSVVVFAWLKASANVEPVVDCKDGTSAIVASYECSLPDEGSGESGSFDLKIKNNGRFNIDGIILEVGIDDQVPVNLLLSKNGEEVLPGHYIFNSLLKPGEEEIAGFYNKDSANTIFTNIQSIRVQPFIYVNNKKIVCQNAIVKQDVNCFMSDISSIPNLISWWKFNGDLVDTIGGYNGVVYGNPGWVEGVSRQALDFDGVDDYVETPSVNPTDAITVGAWVKSNNPDEYSGLYQFVSKYSAYLLGSDPTISGSNPEDPKTVCFIFSPAAGSCDTPPCPPWVYGTCYIVQDPDDNWHHFIGTYDSETGLVKLYVDGVLKDTTQTSGLINLDSGPINVGRNEHYTDEAFNGKIDEVMIFDRALTPREISQIYDYFNQ